MNNYLFLREFNRNKKIDIKKFLNERHLNFIAQYLFLYVFDIRGINDNREVFNIPKTDIRNCIEFHNVQDYNQILVSNKNYTYIVFNHNNEPIKYVDITLHLLNKFFKSPEELISINIPNRYNNNNNNNNCECLLKNKLYILGICLLIFFPTMIILLVFEYGKVLT